MPFQQNVAFADEVGQWFGKYHSTFSSATGQIRADLFEQDGMLVAHVSFPTGVDLSEVTDQYLADLHDYADNHGFAGKLRIVYADR